MTGMTGKNEYHIVKNTSFPSFTLEGGGAELEIAYGPQLQKLAAHNLAWASAAIGR